MRQARGSGDDRMEGRGGGGVANRTEKSEIFIWISDILLVYTATMTDILHTEENIFYRRALCISTTLETEYKLYSWSRSVS